MTKIYIVAALFILFSCSEIESSSNQGSSIVSYGDYKLRTIVYENCEYILTENKFVNSAPSITHKENCRYCMERKK